MAIHVKDIGVIMDSAWKVRQAGKRTIPCFSGPSGIGKSQAVHQWVAKMAESIPGFRMIDLRGATIDSSDTRGLPWKDDKSGTTVFLPPDFLPREGSGLLFIDEINRSPTPVTNCFMSLFTEWNIGNYTLPKGWMIATAINPADSEAYDVNTMDAALENRVRTYDVKFDHKCFLSYAKKNEWSGTILNFLESGEWVYKEPGQGDGKYVAPRSWEELSDIELFGDGKKDTEIHSDFSQSALGKNLGMTYWNFCHKTKPILYDDLLKDLVGVDMDRSKITLTESFKAFAKYADPKKASGGTSYRGDLVNSSVQSFLNQATKSVDKLEQDLVEAVCRVLPADQSAALIQGIAMTSADPARFISDFKSKYKELFIKLRTSVKDGQKTEGAINP